MANRQQQKKTFVPAEVFPPGDILRKELEARGWSQLKFAEILDRPPQLVNGVINAQKRITEQTAVELAEALGTSPEFLLNLETAYRLSRAKPKSPGIAARAKMAIGSA